MSRLALVTGASSGIGADTARHLAAAGWRVVLVARDAARLNDVCASIDGQAFPEPCDASDSDLVIAMADRVRNSLGVPDLIVNAAGVGRWARIEETSPAEARAMVGAPYLAAFNVVHAFMDEMLRRGSGTLIHVNSPAAYVAWPAAVGYTAARAALHGFHEALRQDLAGTGVQSCEVVFGVVASEYFAHNPGGEARIPGLARTIRTLTTAECAAVIVDVARRPRAEVVHPFLLRVYRWQSRLTPGLVRWLLWRTGDRRRA